MIRIKEPNRTIIINEEYISSINYFDCTNNYSMTIIMNNNEMYHIYNKEQINNLLTFLNPKIIEV